MDANKGKQMTNQQSSRTIQSLAAQCVTEARKHGYEGASYELTAADCEWIVDQLGSEPTTQQWHDLMKEVEKIYVSD
jgi:hypothetical protein